MQQRIGVIDLGSNTTRLIVMEYLPHHSFKLLDEVRDAVRLAEGIGEDGQLQPAAMRHGIETMRMFHSFCNATHVEQIVPVATSAVREASNQAEFLRLVEQEAGLKFRVLSAQEEAYYGYLGAANSLNISNAFLIDIGGGSTEVTMIRRRKFERSFSQPLGALRASDRYVHSDPISNKDFKALDRAISECFANLNWFHDGGSELLGIGGTIRALAEIDMYQRSYPLDRVHGYVYTLERLNEMVDTLRDMTVRQRIDQLGLNRDRADVILAGAMILRRLMRQAGFNSITVGGNGLREGVFYEHFLAGEDPPLFTDMRGFSVQNVAHNYNYEEPHSAKVREWALSLFDQLRPLHGYGKWERELLGYGATLHDIGVAVSYYDHHKHGAYLILNSPLLGFTHREIVILASLVRYHRKGDVKVDEYNDILEPDDTDRISRLASLLRLAEHLERSKSQVIQSLRVEIGNPICVFTHTNGGDATVEIWDTNRQAGLFKKAFGRDVEIV